MTIKEKISISIPLPTVFSKIKLNPDLMYLWGVYNLNDKREYIMLIQKNNVK